MEKGGIVNDEFSPNGEMAASRAVSAESGE